MKVVLVVMFHPECELVLVSREFCMRRKLWWHVWVQASVLNTVWNLWFWQISKLFQEFISACCQWIIWNYLHLYCT